jgi:DNA-binding NtrC family response regulator
MILIVDDDNFVTTSLSLELKQAGYLSHCAGTPAEALKKLESQRYQLVLQDMNFSRSTTGDEGLQLLGKIREHCPDVPVILMTAWGSISLAVKGMKAGATDFMTKPWSHQQLLQSIETALGLAQISRFVVPPASREELDKNLDFSHLVGRDPAFVKVLGVVGKVCTTDASILITGESGTGKELVAEALHTNSKRRGRPFVKVNLGGISSTLFESEMFGHVRGAFTDARSDRKGRFEMAQGGTIFLDEIGELDPSSQVKMLRVLQDRTYEVLGSSVTRSVDVRIISATNRNLAELVQKGEFREDLLYRLNLIGIHVPPLRERRADIPLLATYFLEGLAKVYRRPGIGLTEAAQHWLQNQAWPGNVRQLRQMVERAVLLTDRDELDLADFQSSASMETVEPDPELSAGTTSRRLDEMEKAMIVKALQDCNGNLSKVAEELGLSRPALYRRLERHGIRT